MSAPDYDTVLTNRLWVMRIIIVALVLGLAVFCGIAVVVREMGNMPAPPATPLLTYLSFAWAALMLAGSFIVPVGFMVGQRRRLAQVDYPTELAHPETAPTDPAVAGMWLGMYHVQLVMGAAMLEGAGFFLLIAYMIEGTVLSLAAGIVFIVLMAVRFPTRARVERWMDKQRGWLMEQRAGSAR
jgi:hypothetical protein